MSTSSNLTPEQLELAAKRVKRWLEREDLAARQLAEDIQAKKDTVYLLLNNRKASRRTLERIAERMGTSVDHLISPMRKGGHFPVSELRFSGQSRHYLPGIFSQSDFVLLADALHLKPSRKGAPNPHATKVGSMVIRKLESLYRSREEFLAAVEEGKKMAPIIWTAADIAKPIG